MDERSAGHPNVALLIVGASGQPHATQAVEARLLHSELGPLKEPQWVPWPPTTRGSILDTHEEADSEADELPVRTYMRISRPQQEDN